MSNDCIDSRFIGLTCKQLYKRKRYLRFHTKSDKNKNPYGETFPIRPSVTLDDFIDIRDLLEETHNKHSL